MKEKFSNPTICDIRRKLPRCCQQSSIRPKEKQQAGQSATTMTARQTNTPPKYKKMRQFARNVILIVLVGQFTRGTAATASHSLTGTKSSIVSIPLIPHRVQKKRRQLELSYAYNTTTTTSLRVERPTHYYRRHLGNDDLLDPDAAKAQQVAGLYQGYGTHYADLWCGTPPQRQTVIVDTGSGVTAFPCLECTSCGVPDYHIDALFDQTKSSTYHELTCQECLRGSCNGGKCSISMSYQEGSSWSAKEVSDICYVGGFHDRPVNKDTGKKKNDDMDPFHAPSFAFNMKFGCQTRLTGLFKTQLADGIMGMDVASASFWWQMYDAGKISSKAFSLCFSRQDDVERQGTEAGAMSMGGTDERLHNTPMVYSATQDSTGFYVVHVRKVYLREGGGGKSAISTDPNLKVMPLAIDETTLNSGRVIVDSGTTDTYFSSRLAKPFKEAFKTLTGKDYDHATYKFTENELANMPTILFQLAGDEDMNQKVLSRSSGSPVVGLAGDLDQAHPLDVIVAIPPEHYYEFDSEVDGYVARFYVDEGSGGVLGANAMMGHDVYFDIENYRVGWAESTCNYTALVMDYTDGDWIPPRPSPADASGRVEPKQTSSPDTTGPGNEGTTDDYEPPSDPYDTPGFCSNFRCQITILSAVVFAVVFVAVRLVRRVPAGGVYDLAAGELELQTADSGDDSFVNGKGGYRDDNDAGELT